MLLPILVFLCVSLGLAGLFLWLLPSRADQRLHSVTSAVGERGHNWTQTAVKVVGPFANLSLPTENWESSALHIRFLNAGLRHPDMRVLYFGAKTVLPILFACGTYVFLRATGGATGMMLAWAVATAGLVGCYLPNILLSHLVRSRQREIFENFPDAADLMLVCMEAGLGLDASLARVADEMRRKSVAVATELHLTNLEMRAGSTRATALHNLALRTGVEETRIFGTMLTQADRFGTSIGESLRVFSDELRHRRQMHAEERAAKIPTKMLIPLVVCIFPSIMMVILGPAIIQIIRNVLPMLGNAG
jgi:tight adherence protein C